jgi:hypothetical protein
VYSTKETEKERKVVVGNDEDETDGQVKNSTQRRFLPHLVYGK